MALPRINESVIYEEQAIGLTILREYLPMYSKSWKVHKGSMPLRLIGIKPNIKTNTCILKFHTVINKKKHVFQVQLTLLQSLNGSYHLKTAGNLIKFDDFKATSDYFKDLGTDIFRLRGNVHKYLNNALDEPEAEPEPVKTESVLDGDDPF